MFSSAFIEGETQTANLPADSPIVVNYFIIWLRDTNYEIFAEEIELTVLIDTYFFASKYDIPDFMDRIMNEIHQFLRTMKDVPWPSTIDYVYKNCGPPCGLKRYMAQYFLWCIMELEDNALGDVTGGYHWTTEELVQVNRKHEELNFNIFALLRGHTGKKVKNPSRRDMKCKYHEHGPDRPCLSSPKPFDFPVREAKWVHKPNASSSTCSI
jgi:hypothetical protein